MQKHGGKALAITCDVADECAVKAMIEQTVSMMAVDSNGVFFCCRESLKVMMERKSGKVITVYESRYSFTETVDRLTKAIEDAGATLFANIDQTKAARAVGLALRPTTLLLFGNPTAGTALMEAFPLSALDLPLKLLVWEDAAAVAIAFTPMAIVAQRYDVVGKDALLRAMDGVLTSVAATASSVSPRIDRTT